MIFVDEHSGLRLSGYQHQIKKEFAYLIQRLVRENVISLDELYELNEKALTSEESILPNMRNDISEQTDINDMVGILKSMDKQLSNILGCEPQFETNEDVEEFIKESRKRHGNNRKDTGTDEEGLSDDNGLYS